MLIAPGCLKVIGIVCGLAFVEINDAEDGVFFAIRFDKHGMGCKIEPIRLEDHVIGNFVSGSQVLVEE